MITGRSVRSFGCIPAAFVAGRETATNRRLRAALARAGFSACVASPSEVLVSARPGDLVVNRLDVLPTLDGVEHGLDSLRGLRGRGITVLNSPDALIACHDKLSTALLLGAAGIPQPATAYVGAAKPPPGIRGPFVVKPRFGSWGRDVRRCGTKRELTLLLQALEHEPWFRRHGALVQELIAPQGHDLRLVVSGGEVIGAVRREAAPGEWRTNVALGATRQPTTPPAEACALAVLAAAAVGADLVGVDLLPDGSSWRILELNGAVDFTADYALDGRDIFDRAVAPFAPAHLASADEGYAALAG